MVTRLTLIRLAILCFVPFSLTACELMLAPAMMGADSAGNAEQRKDDVKHEESFVVCGDTTIGEHTIQLHCSTQEVAARTVSRLRKVYRYFIKWGYSNGLDVHLPGGNFDEGLITARMKAINGVEVSHRTFMFDNPLSDPDYKKDAEKYGHWKYKFRHGTIVAIGTRGKYHKGLRFFFYIGNAGDHDHFAYPSIVYSSFSHRDTPDLDIEVRAYTPEPGLPFGQLTSEQSAQVSEVIVTKLIDRYESVLSPEK